MVRPEGLEPPTYRFEVRERLVEQAGESRRQKFFCPINRNDQRNGEHQLTTYSVLQPSFASERRAHRVNLRSPSPHPYSCQGRAVNCVLGLGQDGALLTLPQHL